MKLTHLYCMSLTIGCAFVPPVSADFVNVTIHNENDFFDNHPHAGVQAAWKELGGTLDVYRIYANFDSGGPDDHVFKVTSSPDMPVFLFSSSGTFFNVIHEDGYGGHVHYSWPVSPSLYGAHPELAWDTYGTLGFGPFNDQGGFLVSVPGDNLQFNWVSTTTGWTYGQSFPSEGDAVPGGPSGFRVGLFQVTVPAGADVWGAVRARLRPRHLLGTRNRLLHHPRTRRAAAAPRRGIDPTPPTAMMESSAT